MAPEPAMTATGRNSDSSVEKPAPSAVRGRSCRRGIVYGADGSQFCHRTPPGAGSSSIRSPGRRELARDLDRDLTVWAGMTPAASSTAVAAGSARDDEVDGADGLDVGRHGDVGAREERRRRRRPRRRAPSEQEHEARRSAPRAGGGGAASTTGISRLRRTIASSSASRAATLRRGRTGRAGRPRAASAAVGAGAGSVAPEPRPPAPGRPRPAAPAAPRARSRPRRPPRPRRRAAPRVSTGFVSSSAARRAPPRTPPTDANTGSPADAASARADASGATMSEPLARDHRLARQQPEVDPRRRDPRPGRHDERDPRVRRLRGSGRPPR